MKTVVLVGIGGFIGSIARYLATLYFNKIVPPPFPFGTFMVNIIGCLLIGIFFGVSERLNWMSSDLRIFLTTGVCGGFTTFSAFAYENVRLLQSSDYMTFALYAAASFVVCLVSTFSGIALARI
ncbi:fluoride efflux transporter CrcB [Chryseolinea sp. T2]|uniref:fluoride efflux transporter CrcB n=1 Tax=Chryseolinea sp. T2 TaxID=3129255 RepID=UPI0030788C63